MSSDANTLESSETQANQPLPSGNGHDPAPNGHAPETAIELAAKTLAGDLRDGLWRVLQDYGLLLGKDESQQRRIAEAITTECGGLTSRAVTVIAARDFPAISIMLEQISFEPKGIKLKMGMSGLDRPRRHELVDAQNRIVLLVLADPSAFQGARGAVAITADPTANGEVADAGEPELPLNERIAELAEVGHRLAEDMRATPPGHAPPNLAAQADGWEDGREGVRDHAARWPSGTYGHADYALGYAKGQEERAAAGQPVEPVPEPDPPAARRRGRRTAAEASA